MRVDRAMIRLEVDAEVRAHPAACKPSIQEHREASILMLIEEDAVPGAARFADFLRQQGDGFVPGSRAPVSAALDHRRAEPVWIVQSLERRLTARAQRAL